MKYVAESDVTSIYGERNYRERSNSNPTVKPTVDDATQASASGVISLSAAIIRVDAAEAQLFVSSVESEAGREACAKSELRNARGCCDHWRSVARSKMHEGVRPWHTIRNKKPAGELATKLVLGVASDHVALRASRSKRIVIWNMVRDSVWSCANMVLYIYES